MVFTTQTSLATFLTGSALYAIVRSTVFAVVYLALGAALFGVSFAGAKRLGGAPGAVVEHERHAGPWDSLRCLHHGVQTGTPAAFLLRGVAYPVAVLPGWMQALSVVFPHTYALEALRLTLLQGAPLSAVATDVGALVPFAAIILPTSFVVFRHAVGRARMEGSLAQF